MIWTVFRWLLSLLLVLVGVAMVAGGLVLPELSADRFAYVGGGIACALVALAVLRRARDEDGTLGGLRRMSEGLRARRARIEREGLRGEAVSPSASILTIRPTSSFTSVDVCARRRSDTERANHASVLSAERGLRFRVATRRKWCSRTISLRSAAR